MRNWLNSNWLELLITILVAVIDVAMITPWIVVLLVTMGHDGVDPIVPIGAGLIGVVSFWSARELLTRSWDIAAMRMVSLGIWLATVIIWYGMIAGAGLAAPIQFIDQVFQFDSLAVGLLILGGAAWWRGVWLASTEEIFFTEFIRSAALRMIAAHVLVLVVAALFWEGVSTPIRNIAVVMIPVGFAACLLAATGIQVRSARTHIRAPEDQPKAGAGWLGAGAGIAGGILLVAAIVAGTAGREAWQLVLWPILLVLRGLNYLVDWIVLALALIAYIIFLPIFWVVQRLIQDRDEPDFVQETGDVLEPAEDTPGPIEVLPDPVLQVLQWAVVAGIIIFVVWFALRQLRKRQIAKSEDDEYEVRESVWSKDALMNDLSEMLRSLRPDWTRRRGGVNLRRAPETVRDAYRYTLVHAGRQGYARVLNESPIRYSSRLKATEPSVSDPLDDLTERYLRARYAEQTSDEDVQIAREDWEVIRERLRRRKEES